MMPISATGNKGALVSVGTGWIGPAPYPRYSACGFTLLEIMLVLAIMAVAVALVVPDFFYGSGPTLSDEARRLQMAMRLAAEDAQIYGVPICWTATTQAYRFETWKPTGTWGVDRKGSLQPHVLPTDIHIASVKQGQATFLSAMASSSTSPDATIDGDRAIGQVLFWPDGSLTMADVELVRETSGVRKSRESQLLHLRPGFAGIRLSDVGR